MNDPDSLDHTQSRLADGLLATLQLKTATVLSEIAALLEGGTIEDEADRRIVEDAAAFIERPTEEYSDIRNHTTRIGDVLVGYEMRGVDLPYAIDEMHRYLLTLSCIDRIKFVEAELEYDPVNSPRIKEAMKWVVDPATHLSRGYKDSTLLDAVNELQERLDKG